MHNSRGHSDDQFDKTYYLYVAEATVDTSEYVEAAILEKAGIAPPKPPGRVEGFG